MKEKQAKAGSFCLKTGNFVWEFVEPSHGFGKSIYRKKPLKGMTMKRPQALLLGLVTFSALVGVASIEVDPSAPIDLRSTNLIHGGPHIELIDPFNYAVIPPGTPIKLDVSGSGFTTIQVALDGGSAQNLEPPYIVLTDSWPTGTRYLRVDARDGVSFTASRTFVFFLDPAATWLPDTIPVDIILVGFPIAPQDLENRLTSYYPLVRTLGGRNENFDLTFEFRVQAAGAAYQAGLLDYLRVKATYRDDLQARLNLTALIDQRDNGTPRDIFDSLVGWEINTAWAEFYLGHVPPIPGLEPEGYTFYVLNLSALDDPGQGKDHWFVEEVLDPDTRRLEDWWRLEWDNDLNTPMGYPLNIWGGPNHVVYIDPTAYQWYLDWTHAWWDFGMERAPYGLQWQEVAPGSQTDYLAGIVDDLIQGLAADLPGPPPAEPAVLVKNYVLSGSLNHTVSELRWVSSDLVFQTYLEATFPHKSWTVNTTFAPIADYPALQSAVDENTTFAGGQGGIDGLAVWTYLLNNKDQFLSDEAAVFEILSVNLLYDNRSMVYAGREFTGLGGQGITAIFLKTDRLFDPAGLRQKGLTTIISHETGHNLGYGHQFGPNFRSDFVRGNMGYFQNDLEYGRFWEDALHRLLLRTLLRNVISLLDAREPLDLAPEFTSFYGYYRNLAFLDAFAVLKEIEAMLTDAIAPVADAGEDLLVAEDLVVTLDGTGSSDNHRVLNYTWDFGDGTQGTTAEPRITKSWEHPGVYSVILTVVDAAGNSDSDSVLVTVADTTPPSVSFTSPEWGTTLYTSQVTLSWEAADNGRIASIEVQVDGGGDTLRLSGELRETTLSDLPNGPHTVRVTVIDQGGNRGQDTVYFTIDAGGLPPLLSDQWIWVVLAAVIGGLLGASIVLVLRRRPKG